MKKWLDRLLNKGEPELRYPAGQVLNFWVIDPQYATPVKVRSRSNPGQHFEVRLDKLHCSCPGFRNERSQFGNREVRRVCPHIYEAVKLAKVDSSAHPLMLLVAHHGRKFREFHRMRVEAANADIVFGYKPGVPQIGVYAVVNNHDTVHGSYDVATKSWLKEPAEKHQRVLVGAIEKVFGVKA